jgi:ABC-type antimicrobial peptide transport system permease subunit
MFRYAIKELLKRKKLYLLNVMTIALVTLMIISLSSLAIAYKEAARLPFEDIQGNIIIQKSGNVPETIEGVLLSCSLAPISQELITEINKVDGVKDISSVLSLWVFDPDNFKRVSGLNFSDNFGKKLAGSLIAGSIPKTDNQAIVEKTYAKKYSLDLGSKTVISGQQFEVSGIVMTTGSEVISSDIYLNLKPAQEMAYQSKNLQHVEQFGKTDVNVILINAGQSDLKRVTQKVKEILAGPATDTGKTPLGQTIGTYTVYTPESFENQISTIFLLSDRLAWIISLILLIGAAFIIGRNTLHSILEKKKEFGIMKAVGFKNRDIQNKITIETFIQILTGFFVGLGLSAIAVAILQHSTVSIAIPWELSAYPHFLLSDPNEANVVQTHFLPIKLELAYVFVSLIVVLVIGLATSFLSIRQINKLKPMEVMRYE